MAKILILAEKNAENVKTVSLEILGKLGNTHEIEVAAFGDLQSSALDDLVKYGASTIHSIKGANLETYSPEGFSQALKALIDQGKYDYVFGGATSMGKDLLPRVAGMCDSGMVSDVTQFSFEGDNFSAIRPLFAGKCLAKVQIEGNKPHFVTVRPNSLGLTNSPVTGTLDKKDFLTEAKDLRAVIKEIVQGTSKKLDLTEANIIVSGGRGMKNSDNFKILDELAEVLGATVGASRAAVDDGYAPHSMQVGQTGKTVSPSLYIACGISGAIQHLAGMRTSKVIVAVNNKEDAPIFAHADYGIVGDLFQIVPLLTEEFKKVLK